MDAINNPSGSRKYSRARNSLDIPDTQKADIDLGLDKPVVHGEALANVAGDVNQQSDYLAALEFNEEPLRIIIEENGRSDLPETHAPVAVQGKNAEVLINGKWVEVGWLPIGQEIITKRKYVEVLLRAKTDTFKTIHDDATVERPRNSVNRRTSAQYPVTVLQDNNPKGGEWLVRCRTNH
jgi:hypothetical protein